MIIMPKKLGVVTILGKNCDIPEGSKTRIAYMIQRQTSCLHNPYIRGVHGTKEEVIKLFEKHLDKELLDPESDISLLFEQYLDTLIAGRDVHLKCGCKPASCHGDIIKDRLEKRLRQMVAFPEDDGITHINVYSKGATMLGRTLSNFYKSPFVLKTWGSFSSIEGLWFYLKSCTRDEKYRKLHGIEAKTYKSKLPYNKDFELPEDEFRATICGALSIKILTNSLIRDGLAFNRLPLLHYYVDSGRVIDPGAHTWVIDHLSQYSNKQYVTPSFNNLCPEIYIEPL